MKQLNFNSKKSRQIKTLFLIFLMSANLGFGQNAQQQVIENDISATQLYKNNRTKENDRVNIVLTKVKKDSKAQFEKWVDEVFYQALYTSSDPIRQKQVENTRYLTPAKQNDDGTWTYAWIMDPLLTDVEYNIPAFLEKEYGEEKGKALWSEYLTYMAGPPQVIELVETGR